MKQFRTVAFGDLISLLDACSKDCFVVTGIVDVTEHLAFARDKPQLKDDEGTYRSLELTRFDETKRYVGKGNDTWILYEMMG